MMTTLAELDAAFEAAQSGKGIRVQTVAELRRLADHALSRGGIVCNVETFEVVGDSWFLRPEYMLFQGDTEFQDMPPAQRIPLGTEELARILAEIEAEGFDVFFQVWIDELRG